MEEPQQELQTLVLWNIQSSPVGAQPCLQERTEFWWKGAGPSTILQWVGKVVIQRTKLLPCQEAPLVGRV